MLAPVLMYLLQLWLANRLLNVCPQLNVSISLISQARNVPIDLILVTWVVMLSPLLC